MKRNIFIMVSFNIEDKKWYFDVFDVLLFQRLIRKNNLNRPKYTGGSFFFLSSLCILPRCALPDEERNLKKIYIDKNLKRGFVTRWTFLWSCLSSATLSRMTGNDNSVKAGSPIRNKTNDIQMEERLRTRYASLLCLTTHMPCAERNVVCNCDYGHNDSR